MRSEYEFRLSQGSKLRFELEILEDPNSLSIKNLHLVHFYHLLPTCFHKTYNYDYFSLLGVPDDVNEDNDDQLRTLNRYKYLKKIEKTPALKDDHEYSRLIQEKHQEALNPNAETSTIPYEITNDGYKCTLCDKVYLNQQNFKYHFDKHHPRYGNIGFGVFKG